MTEKEAIRSQIDALDQELLNLLNQRQTQAHCLMLGARQPLCAGVALQDRAMTYRVFVDGQEGTTGLRIHEYLAQRADIEVLRIDADKRKDTAERARLLNAADVAFLCLPDAAAREAAAAMEFT